MNNDPRFESPAQLIRAVRSPVVFGSHHTAGFKQLEEPDGLSDYWRLLVKRRWTVLAVALGLTAVVIAVSLIMKPVFLATARLEVEPETPLLESNNDIYQRVDADDPFIQTQIQILKGPTLAW